MSQLELFAPAFKPRARKAKAPEDDERQWIRYPGRVCAGCEHYELASYPFAACRADSYLILGVMWQGRDDTCHATLFPGEGPRPAKPGAREYCATCAEFLGCEWWMRVKPCRDHKEKTA